MKRSDFKAQKVLTELSDFRGGIFRAIPLAWKLQTKEGSQSAAIAIQYGIVSQWFDEEKAWSPEWPLGWFMMGYHYIVKRDGTASEAAFKMVSDAGLWFGDFSDFEDGKQPPELVVHIDVRLEEAKGGFPASWKIQWVSPDTDIPRERSGLAPTDASVLQGLRSRFQGQFKALGAKKPAGAPPAAGAPPRATVPAGPSAPARPTPAAPARPTPAAAHAPAAAPAPAPTSLPVPAEPSIGDVFDAQATNSGTGFPWEAPAEQPSH